MKVNQLFGVGLLVLGLLSFTKKRRRLYYQGRFIANVVSISKPDQYGFVKMDLRNIQDTSFSNQGQFNASSIVYVKTVAEVPTTGSGFYIVG